MATAAATTTTCKGRSATKAVMTSMNADRNNNDFTETNAITSNRIDNRGTSNQLDTLAELSDEEGSSCTAIGDNRVVQRAARTVLCADSLIVCR